MPAYEPNNILPLSCHCCSNIFFTNFCTIFVQHIWGVGYKKRSAITMEEKNFNRKLLDNRLYQELSMISWNLFCIFPFSLCFALVWLAFWVRQMSNLIIWFWPITRDIRWGFFGSWYDQCTVQSVDLWNGSIICVVDHSFIWFEQFKDINWFKAQKNRILLCQTKE
jgi:hypothetical protein